MKKVIQPKLDYRIKGTDNRLKELEESIKEFDDTLVEYFDDYYNPYLNQNQNLSDKDIVCKELEKMADYVLFEDNKEQRDFLNKNRLSHVEKKEFQFSVDKIDGMMNANPKERTMEKKNMRKGLDFKVKTKDRLDNQYIYSMGVAIGYLKFCLVNDFKPDDRISDRDLVFIASETEKKIKNRVEMFDEDYIENNKLTKDEKRLYKKTEINLRKEELEMNKMIHGYFTFNDGGTTVLTLDDNTGYYDKNGEYIEVSNNKVELSNPEHVYAILKNYSELKESSYEDLNSNTRALIQDLENLIDSIQFNDYQMKIISMIVDKYSEDEMLETLKLEFGIEVHRATLFRWIDKIKYTIAGKEKYNFKYWATKKYNI